MPTHTDPVNEENNTVNRSNPKYAAQYWYLDTAREVLDNYLQYPEDLSASYVSEFVDDNADFNVDELDELVTAKLDAIAEAILHDEYGDNFIASLYEQGELTPGTVEYASAQLLVDYLQSPEDLTDEYLRSYIADNSAYNVDHLREACQSICDVVATRIARKFSV